MPLFGTGQEQMKIKCPNCGKIQNISDVCINKKTVKCLKCKAEIPVTPSKSSFPKKTVLTGFAVFFGLLVLIIILAIAIPSNEPEHRATKQKKYNREVEKINYQTEPERDLKKYTVVEKQSDNNPSLEYQLAIIEKGGYVDGDDIIVKRFRYLLRTLKSKTPNSKQEIADISVGCVQKLLRDKYGIEMSLLTFMESVDASIPIGIEIDYAEVAVAYVQLVKN